MTIKQYLAKKEPVKTVLIQARIPFDLHKDILEFVKEQKIAWSTVMTGALLALRDEVKKGKK